MQLLHGVEGGVEERAEADVLEYEHPSFFRFPGELAVCVAALMMEEAVVVVVEVWSVGYDNHRPCARSEDPGEVPQGRAVIRNVLEQVRADDRVQGRISEGSNVVSAWTKVELGTLVRARGSPA